MIRRYAIVCIEAEDEAGIEAAMKTIEKPRLEGPTVVIVASDLEVGALAQDE